MDIKLTFLGAAQNVTGSKYLLETPQAKILVDYGIFQERDLNERNWANFPIPPAQIDAIFLTHAHLDHCGLLPRLVKQGFDGPIYGTAATIELAKIVIADCAKINEEDAEFKRKRHEKEGRKGPHPETPLYTLEEAQKVFPLFVPCDFNRPLKLLPGITTTFIGVGHILGAASLKMEITQGEEKRTVLFSGDVGRWDMPILQDPAPIGDADYILCESTYGDRCHGSQEAIPDQLANIINTTVKSGGNIVIPSFAIERTQDLIYYLAKLLKADRIPHLRTFIDSPMAVRVSDVFKKHPQLFDAETKALAQSIRMPGLTMVRTTADSKSINHISGTAIIIAGAGMCTGGRIKHHLVTNLPRKESTILFVGYQAANTLGRIICDGATKVRILGEEYPVKARIERISGFSAHADQNELIDWLKTCTTTPRKIFITHGEPQAAQAFTKHVINSLGWNAVAPERDTSVTLD